MIPFSLSITDFLKSIHRYYALRLYAKITCYLIQCSHVTKCTTNWFYLQNISLKRGRGWYRNVTALWGMKMWGMGNAQGSGMGNRSGSESRSKESVGRGHRKTGCQSARMRWTEHWGDREKAKKMELWFPVKWPDFSFADLWIGLSMKSVKRGLFRLFF